MAISQQDIIARINAIQAAGGGDTAATRAQIAKEAQEFGVSPEQLGQATGFSGSDIRSMAKEAGAAFTPRTPTGGMLGGPSVSDVSSTVSVGGGSGVTLPIPQDSGMLSSSRSSSSFTPYTPQVTGGTIKSAAEGDQSSLSDLLLSTYTSGGDTTQLRPLLEEISKTATGDEGTDPAYNFLVGATGEAALKNEYNQAVARGDTARAQEIKEALERGTESAFRFYEGMYGEGAAHTLTQDLFNDPFGIGAPGKYQTSFFEGLGDAVSDVVQNPYVQAVSAFIPGVGPAVSSVLQAWGTLDSGKELSPAQIVAAVAGASELSNLEGGNLVRMLPKEVQGTVTAIQNALEGGFDEAYSALKDAGLEGTSEQFAAFEDAIRNVVGDENIEAVSGSIAGIEDAIRGVIGDENIEAFSSGLAGIEDLIRGQFGSQQEQLDALAAALAAERQPRFTAQRGYQPGLPVDIEFDRPERSAVLDILNQPSSMRRA